ncbi:MAG: T9SS type A sorting domain-containing protein, partial [Bacteroidia bacterium]|nr:T9SS type A sorting domain-containing protein [Bacteroidia bacterium]NNM15357.1 T9SS type A sorting domain-containing protein [Bacteroidia bacterium]
HVMFKFQFLNNGGNNIFIDNINLFTGVSVNELNGSIANFNLVPNPANGFTTIELDLKKGEKIKIDVLDLSGRLVEPVIEKKLDSGSHFIPIISKLSNGVYFVTLQTQNFSSAKKLIIIN